MIRITRSTLLIAALTLATSAAYPVGKSTLDPNTVKTPAAAAPIELTDTRLDQKIEYEAGNARLHDVIADVAKMSGVAIFCGSSPSDWPVRDMPVTVAAHGISVKSLLNYLAYSTQTIIRQTKTDKGIIVYRMIIDPRAQRTMDAAKKAARDWSRNVAIQRWDMATRLKDIPAAEIKPPSENQWGSDQLAGEILLSQLLSSMDPALKEQILSGDSLVLSPRTAPANLRKPLLDLLTAVDKMQVGMARRQPHENYGRVAITGTVELASPQDLDGASIAFMRSGAEVCISADIRIPSATPGTLNRRNWQSSTSSLEYRATSNNNGRLKVPEEPQQAYVKPELHYNNTIFSSVPALPKTVRVQFEDDNKPKWAADAILAISKAAGISIVCGDFETHRHEKDLRGALANECSLDDALGYQNFGIEWAVDADAKAVYGVYGSWGELHSILPADLVDDLLAKANGDGIDLDDLTRLTPFTSEVAREWLRKEAVASLPIDEFTEARSKPIWEFYASLSPEDKQLAKSSIGLPLAKFGKERVGPVLKCVLNQSFGDAHAWDGSTTNAERLSNPDIFPTLTLRLQFEEMSRAWMLAVGILPAQPAAESEATTAQIEIPQSFAKPRNYSIIIEGSDAQGKVSAKAIGPYYLPCFSSQRQKVLTEALNKQNKATSAEKSATN